MTSKSIRATSVEEVPSLIREKISDSFQPTLAIAFCHYNFDIQSLQQELMTTGIPFIGATSAGEFIEGDIEKPSVTIILMDLDPSAFKIYASTEVEKDIYTAGTELGKFSKNCFAKPALLILASGLPDGELLVKRVEDGAGEFIPAFGGIASEDLTFDGTYVISNIGISPSGLAALILDTEKVSAVGLIYGGWRPMGIKRTITKSTGNIVYEIDNEPALNLIARYSRIPVDEFKQGSVAIANLTSHFQLQLYRENNYPVLRAPIFANLDDGSLTFTGAMPEGGMIQFSLAPSFEVIDNVIDEYNNLHKQYPDPEAVLLFSCKARQLVLGPWIVDEIQRIKGIWKAPLAGFLTYGEIGKTNSSSTEFHNMACSLLLLKEK